VSVHISITTVTAQRHGRLDWNGESSDSGQSAAPRSTVYQRGSANDHDDKPVPVRCLCVSCQAGQLSQFSVVARICAACRTHGRLWDYFCRGLKPKRHSSNICLLRVDNESHCSGKALMNFSVMRYIFH